jgi:hypothetical protein
LQSSPDLFRISPQSPSSLLSSRYAANSSSSAFASFRSIEPFSKPTIHGSKQFAGLLWLPLVAPESRHAHCGTKFPGLGLLLTVDRARSKYSCAFAASGSMGFSRTTFASYGLSQEEILQHEFPFPSCKRTTADLALYLAIICLRPSFNFDHLIVGAAVRACEWIECASRHGTPPANSRLLTVRWCGPSRDQSVQSTSHPSASVFELLRLRISYSRQSI